MTFVDFVTPVPADWLNNVNTFVHTSPTPAQLSSAYAYTQALPQASVQAAITYVGRTDHKNLLDFGGIPDGVTDNTPYFNAALAAAVAQNPGHLRVHFPAGKFYFSSPLTYTFPASPTIASLTITGEGQDVTELLFAASVNGANITANNQFNSVHIRDMTFSTTGQGPTTCYGINLVQGAASIPNPANTPQSDITNVTFRGSDGYQVTNYWARGVNVAFWANVCFNGVYVAGFGFSTDGVFLAGSSSLIPAPFNFFNCTFNFCHSGISYEAYAQGLSVVACNFTGNQYGILSAPSQSGLDQCSVTGSQFNCTIAGIGLMSPVGAVSITNNFFLVQNNSSGIYMDQTYDYTIFGNTFNPAILPRVNQTGITIDHYFGVGGVITGNSFLNLSNAVLLTANSQQVNVQSNSYHSNTTNVANGGTGNTIGGGSA